MEHTMYLTQPTQSYRSAALDYVRSKGNSAYPGNKTGLGDLLTTPVSDIAKDIARKVKQIYANELAVMKTVAVCGAASTTARAITSAHMPPASDGLTSLVASAVDYAVFHIPAYTILRHNEIKQAKIEGKEKPSEARIAAEYVSSFGIADKIYVPATAAAQYALQKRGMDPASAAFVSAGIATAVSMFVLPPIRAAVKSISRKIGGKHNE
jgi:hypothetical protein